MESGTERLGGDNDAQRGERSADWELVVDAGTTLRCSAAMVASSDGERHAERDREKNRIRGDGKRRERDNRERKGVEVTRATAVGAATAAITVDFKGRRRAIAATAIYCSCSASSPYFGLLDGGRLNYVSYHVKSHLPVAEPRHYPAPLPHRSTNLASPPQISSAHYHPLSAVPHMLLALFGVGIAALSKETMTSVSAAQL
ncbi:hypothetical protein HN873_062306 [Arachis hypogaea]